MNLAVSREIITPEIARQYLKQNECNRPISESNVRKIASALLRGEWAFNGDTIRFSKEGRLMDGQHRLTACLLTGISLDSLVVRGLESSSFSTIDTGGRARTTGDVLSIAGWHNTAALAAAANLLYRWLIAKNPVSSVPEYQPSASQIQDLVSSTPDLVAAVERACKLTWCKKYLAASKVAFCMHAFTLDSGEELAHRFFDSLESGTMLKSDSPILLLRNRMVLERESKGSVLQGFYRLGMTFKAFKHYRDNKPLKILKFAHVAGEDQAPYFRLR